jgi:hypothetical protein
VRTGHKGAQGFLADEMRNITFQGERAAAVNAVDWWAQYVAIDARIRSLEQAGRHDQAVQLCLGEEANQSDWAFNGFIKALDGLIQLNQSEFDKAVDLGFESLAHFEYVAPAIALVAALACLFGVLPRIREYSA